MITPVVSLTKNRLNALVTAFNRYRLGTSNDLTYRKIITMIVLLG